MNNLSGKTHVAAFLLLLSFSLVSFAQTKGWGLNASAQLGIGNQISPQPNPVTITGVPDATGISTGNGTTLFLKADGTVVSNGGNAAGELGNGTVNPTTFQLTPAPVVNLTHVTQVSAGYVFGVALRDNGTVWTWGHNRWGQIGNGTISTNACECIPTPTQALISDVVQIDAGSNFTIVLKSDGTVWGWGLGQHGELGRDDFFTQAYPTPVQIGADTPGFNNMVAISASETHGMALKADGTVWLWGGNVGGEMGNGTSIPSTQPGCKCLLPHRSTSVSNIAQIATGGQSSLARQADGRILTWGRGFSGNGTWDNTGCACRVSPVENTTIMDAIDFTAGGGTVYARRVGGSVWAWGSNTLGEVGNGTLAPSNTGCGCELSPVQTSVGTGNALIGSGFFNGFASIPLFTTPTGTNVRHFGHNASFTFSNVTTSGTASYSTIDPATTGLNVPPGYTIQSKAVAYNITSTAISAGTNYVCFNVTSEYSPAEFALLKVLHEEGSDLVDRTSSSVFSKRLVCAGVNSWSRFVVAKNAVSTGSQLTVSGQVLNQNGRAIMKARVSVTDKNGVTRTTLTNGFGYYTFDQIAATETYTFAATAKGYTIDPKTVTVNGNLTDLDLIAQ